MGVSKVCINFFYMRCRTFRRFVERVFENLPKVKPATPHEAFGNEKKSFAEETDEIDDLPF